MEEIKDKTIDSQLKASWQIISRMYFAESVKHGGSIQGAYFLMNIDSKNGSYATDIAPKMGMKSSSLSRMIKALEDADLITRQSDKEDKRKVKIVLTPKGQNEKDLAKNIVKNFNVLIEEKLGSQRKQELMLALKDVIALAEERLLELKNG